MPSGLGHSPVERRPAAVFLLQQLGFPQRSDLYNLCLQTKKKKKKKKKKKPVPPM
jgi:hypothetical protein